MKVIFFYENARGGGTIAMQNIISEFSQFPEVKTIHTSTKPIKKWGTFYFLGWIIKNVLFSLKFIYKHKGIDWVYTSTFSAGVAAALLKPLLKYKICYHYHVLEIPENPFSFPSKRSLTQEIKIWLLIRLHLFFLHSLDLMIAPSRYSRLQIIKNFKIFNLKIKVIYNGVGLQFFKKPSAKINQKLKKGMGLRKSDIVISYFGRLEKHKNITLLLKVLRELNKLKNAPNYKLQIVYLKPNNIAEKNYKKNLLLLSKKLNVDRYLIWSESPEKLENYYQISDIILLPSTSDNLPLVMLETFASRKMFLSTPVGGVNEVLKKIDQRLIIKSLSPKDLSEQIKNLLSLSKSVKEKIIYKQFAFVKELTWTNVSRKIYKTLMLFNG